MNPEEYEARIVAIEQMVETLVRENRPGNHFHILGGLEKTAQDHDRLCVASDGGSGDQYLCTNARGYRKGRRGTNVEGPS